MASMRNDWRMMSLLPAASFGLVLLLGFCAWNFLMLLAVPDFGRPPFADIAALRPALGAVVAGFKSASTRRINEWRRTPGEKVWLRNYWERVIRDDTERWHIQEYIRSNPARWLQDNLNPSAP